MEGWNKVAFLFFNTQVTCFFTEKCPNILTVECAIIITCTCESNRQGEDCAIDVPVKQAG